MPAIVIIITAFMIFLGAAPLPLFYYDILRYVVTIVFIWAVLFLILEEEEMNNVQRGENVETIIARNYHGVQLVAREAI